MAEFIGSGRLLMDRMQYVSSCCGAALEAREVQTCPLCKKPCDAEKEYIAPVHRTGR